MLRAALSAVLSVQVLGALPSDLAQTLVRYALVPALHMAARSLSDSAFNPGFSATDARSAPLWFPPEFAALPEQLHPLLVQAAAPSVEAEQALTVDLSLPESGAEHGIECVARVLPHLPDLARVKLSTGSMSSSPASPSGSESPDEYPHACAWAELVRAVCALPQITSICMENPEQRMPRYGSGMLSGSCELDSQALDLVAELTRNLGAATGLTSLTLRNLPLRHSAGGAFIEAAGRLPCLTRFHLDSCDVDAQCMRKLNSHLRKFECLDDFHLATLGGATAPDPSLAMVSVGARPSMRSVSLRAPVTVQQAMATVKAVARLTGLQRLSLDLHHAADARTPYYTNSCLLGLCDILADHLPHSMHLTHLAIGGVISAACASSLGELLCRLPRLRRLEVNGLKLKDGHRCSWPVEASQARFCPATVSSSSARRRRAQLLSALVGCHFRPPIARNLRSSYAHPSSWATTVGSSAHPHHQHVSTSCRPFECEPQHAACCGWQHRTLSRTTIRQHRWRLCVG